MLSGFLPPLESEHSANEAIQNAFIKVPTFHSEQDIYEFITTALSTLKACPLAVTSYESYRDALSKQDIHCGSFASVGAREEEDCGFSKDPRSSLRQWSHLELLVKCQVEPAAEDPFDEENGGNKEVAADQSMMMEQVLSCAELAFKYQQRQAVFMVLFLGHYARVLRFDRSGVVATEKIDYIERGAELTAFFVRYCRLGRADRGHDPQASLIGTDDPLWRQLKKHGADAAKKDPESHVQKLFNESLDHKWPWWTLSILDEEARVERSFAVGKPHYYTSGVVSRGTRGYVAVPLDDAGAPEGDFVYLKDAWRRDKEGMRKEGTVLKTLNAASVSHVPTLICHGDLNQSAQSYDKWLDYHLGKTRDDCTMEPHQHYRLVVAEVCKPLSAFENGVQLVWALVCGIIAHEEACAAGHIHRDISAGNILLHQDASGEWEGLLNDWELSGILDAGSIECSEQQLDRVGTWQFMSVGMLLNKTKAHTIADDLESFFHVLVYYAVRFLPHNLSDEATERFFYRYFDDYTNGISGYSCGSMKYFAMRRGVIDVALISRGMSDAAGRQTMTLEFYLPPSSTRSESGECTDDITYWSHPINDLLDRLLEGFQAFYDSKLRRTERADQGEDQEQRAKAQLAERVKTHEWMIWLMLTHLRDFGWPRSDKGKDMKPSEEGVSESENVTSSSIDQVGSKRPRDDGDEGEATKRVRNLA
ncbi:hypothetical protein GSI_04061 [Ganoderma sinense ZZ0214-1]|uniref:Protein kinase domain-containing protein n=1 Tax=Ganoderma sinense ZZ0214-1 TaxID=1077348 RepID=A0A2G8SI42_9APHY|nr:hypothetical protein GSI_04061 [Ganoderma sinense ZZ0214-1]